jgi:hypothetical protein
MADHTTLLLILVLSPSFLSSPHSTIVPPSPFIGYHHRLMIVVDLSSASPSISPPHPSSHSSSRAHPTTHSTPAPHLSASSTHPHSTTPDLFSTREDKYGRERGGQVEERERKRRGRRGSGEDQQGAEAAPGSAHNDVMVLLNV